MSTALEVTKPFGRNLEAITGSGLWGRSWWRDAAVLLLLLLFATVHAADDEDEKEVEPPLPKESAELAQKYAAIAEWEGFFESSESGSVTWSSNGSHGSEVVENSSHGHFLLKRSPHSDAGDARRGVFTWIGGDYAVLCGEQIIASDLQHSEWDQKGRGEEWRRQAGGTLPMTATEFTIWLPTAKEQSALVHVHPGGGASGKTLTSITTGRRAWDESKGNGTDVRRNMSLDATSELDAFVNWYSPVGDVASAPWFQVVRGGPGVLVFPFESTTRADTQKSTPVLTRRSRVVLFPVYNDVEVEVTIADYEKWMPRGSITTPVQPGNSLVASARLVPKNGPPKDLPRAKSFKFELVEVSREPGVCMNWPLLGPDGDNPPEKDPAPDLRFAEENGAILANENLVAQIRPAKDSEGHDSASVRVNSYDFGGSAELRVTCVLNDERKIIGVLKLGDVKLVSIPLPYRRSGSRVAKAWQDLHKLTGADGDDVDEEPVGDGNRGDGFSNYEEYRGFVENRIHLRSKPNRKDLFLQNHIGKQAMEGIFKLTDLTHLAVHYEMRPDEMPNSRRMNVNRSASSPRTSKEYQHGLILDHYGSMDASLADIEGNVFRPKYTDIVVVLESLLVFSPQKEAREKQKTELAVTIAHELLHAIGVRHHGEVDPGMVAWLRGERVVNGVVESWFMEQEAEWKDGGYVSDAASSKVIHIFKRDGNEVLPQDYPDFLSALPTYCYVGCHLGQHSGVVDCVMRYDCANAYKVPSRPNDRFIFAPLPEKTGEGLCTSTVGSDYNDPGLPAAGNRYGNATLGKCAKQICVRDDAPEIEPAPKAKGEK